ncbi:MAG: ATP phosphoribosyltransferase [Candidatus Promineifilaceae bacterium]|nr:ATP phosphoribosyltransferase [Candidatus Promineifilaceae bacterium]
MTRTDIRLGLPSKGILRDGALEFLANCGLKVFRPNPRQYVATIPNLPGLTVLFQRPGDIVVGVRQGSIDFGVTGYDIVAEKAFGSDSWMMLHESLGFGPCTLNLAIPEHEEPRTMLDLSNWADELHNNGRFLRVATKFPVLTKEFLDNHRVKHYRLISPEGTLEIAPEIGFADVIADLVSSGITLRDNHLRVLEDGLILESQACLIANRLALQSNAQALEVAKKLLEFIDAYLRAQGSFVITANIRGASPEKIARLMFEQKTIGGLQGPTISRVVVRDELQHDGGWFAINIIVRKNEIFQAVNELRQIGGSGVIVTPCTYIFEEEPERYQAMLRTLAGSSPQNDRSQ